MPQTGVLASGALSGSVPLIYLSILAQFSLVRVLLELFLLVDFLSNLALLSY